MKFLTTKNIFLTAMLITVLYLALILIAPLLMPLPDTRKPVAPIPAELKIENQRVTFPSTQPGINLVAWWMPKGKASRGRPSLYSWPRINADGHS